MQPASKARDWISLVVTALLPLAALGAMVWLFLAKGDAVTAGIRQNTGDLPRAEKVTFERIVFKPTQIVAYVRNSGPTSITIAGTHINDMATQSYISPKAMIPRLGSAVITIPYDWVVGEPLEVRLVSAAGLFHSARVDVATLTPVPTLKYFEIFALLGVYVGVIPVYLGLAWFPVLRRLSERAMDFFIGFTIGLLLFLGVDALAEALDLRADVSDPLQPTMLILIGLLGSFLAISAVSNLLVSRDKRNVSSPAGLVLAYMIAFGIGIHNMGEGLAIGTAYALGKATLGGLLILGFTIHNTTEGIAIVSPVARSSPTLGQLVLMGIVAGVPTVFGAWVGGFAYSALLGVLFLSAGAGAAFQVVYTISRQMWRRPEGVSAGNVFAGLFLGLLVMYLTGLMVV